MPLISDDIVESLLGGFMLYPQYRYYAYSVEVPGHFKKALKAIQENPNAGYETIVLELEEKYPDIYQWIDLAPQEWDFENFIQTYIEQYKRAKLVENIKSLATRIEKLESSTIQMELNKIVRATLDSNVEVRHIKDVISELIEDLHRIRKEGGIRIPYLWKLVNDLFGGELIVLAGRPGMGKTTLMVNMAEQFARQGATVGFITLEMPDKSLTLKLVQRFWNISLFRQAKELSDEDVSLIEKQFSDFMELPIYFSTRTTTRITSVLATLKYFVTMFDVKIFFIDYLQLLRARFGNRVEELAYITRTLKEFAIENNVSIFLGSQLNRNVEYREDKMPTLADLRESGAIEQDADVVVMLYRPWYYDKNEDKSKLILKIAKQRNGVIGSIVVRYEMDKHLILDE